MRKVEWQDKLLIDELKAKGDIFGYLGGAIQKADDFGVDWRLVIARALSQPPLNSTVYDPTAVEPEKFRVTIKQWDDLKKELKKNKKEKEFYRYMSAVVHLDLYALYQAHYSIFRLSQDRTYGTTEEFVKFVLTEYKRPTFVFYDDEEGFEGFSDWILQRGLEAKYEYYVCFKIFSTIKGLIKFIRDHKEDILHWDENYGKAMDAIRVFRAFARKYWRRKKGLSTPVILQITRELQEIYGIVSETKKHLQRCESILAAEKAVVIEERIKALQQELEASMLPKPKSNCRNNKNHKKRQNHNGQGDNNK